jgi:hypothetical protein
MQDQVAAKSSSPCAQSKSTKHFNSVLEISSGMRKTDLLM